MVSRKISMLLIVILVSALWPYGGVRAAGTASFTMQASNTAPKTGEEVILTIRGAELQELYGYEINISYSPEKWKFISASSLLAGGFSVPAIDENGEITFAYTKVGNATAGTSGSSGLAELKFQSIAEGQSDITLSRIKTVDKNRKALETILGLPAVHFTVPAVITFTDVPEGYWAKELIERAASLDIVNGYADGTFRPKAAVTRAEFVAMLVRGLQVQAVDSGPEPAFTDSGAIGSWAKPYVAAAVANGWVLGFDDGSFKPNQPVTRAEMTVIAARVLQLEQQDAAALAFADSVSIPVWAKPFISGAVSAGIVQGQGNNRFAPAASTTRAEAAAVLLRMIDYKAMAD